MATKNDIPVPLPDLGAGTAGKAPERHPAGRVRHGLFVQGVRMCLFATWFFSVVFTTQITQYLGCPLYFINKDYFYAYMALTKQTFGLFITTITQWFNSTTIRVSGDKSVRGQLRQKKDGNLVTDFPERLVLIANHQIYTDWLYLWWAAYTNSMHGHIFIILKESLKYIPILGTGMMFYGFIFMSRKWETDKPRMQHRLQQLKAQHRGPLSGSQALDPMWLLIFPEGTNLSANTRRKSKAWAEKNNMKDFEHQLLPRSTGLQYCLSELKGTLDWVYDCTIAYEGIPRGEYGQDVFPLRSSFFQGRPPKSVNMYWRRIAVSSIPIDDPKAFDAWVLGQWQIKEQLLEGYAQNGRFPADDGVDPEDKKIGTQSGADQKPAQGAGFIETRVRLNHWYDLAQIFVVMALFALLCNILAKIYNLFRYGNMAGLG